jgi:hypothetical protein
MSDHRRPPRGNGGKSPDTSRRARPRHTASGRNADAEPPEMVISIHTVDGLEGERLARQQAEALWEVTQWLAQNKSGHGQQQTS